jgi:hypothetical protein
MTRGRPPAAVSALVVVLGLLGAGGALGITILAPPDGTVGVARADAPSRLPPPAPAHGIPSDLFPALWSGDEDDATRDAARVPTSGDDAVAVLANATDVLFPRPPAAVEQWNRGDFAEYPHGDQGTSVYPPGAARSDGRYVKDAALAVFAIQPSTVVHDGNRTVHAVAPDGAVLTAVDYRVAVPDDVDATTREETWNVETAEIESLSLSVDGRERARAAGTHTARLGYDSLTPGPTTLVVSATITATVAHTERERETTCRDDASESAANATTNETDRDCSHVWKTTVDETDVESVTVSSRRDVAVYRPPSPAATSLDTLALAGDRDGLFVDPPRRIAALSLGNGYVIHSPWWFYSRSRPAWDTLVRASATRQDTVASPSRPLQIHAVPTASGPTIERSAAAPATTRYEIRRTWTRASRNGPSLSPRIDARVAETYRPLSALVVADSMVRPVTGDRVTVTGLVAGSETTLAAPDGPARTVHPTSIDVVVVAKNRTTATLSVRVRDDRTDALVDSGTLTVGNRTIALTNETATVTVDETAYRGTVLSYEPVPWDEAATLRMPSQTVYDRDRSLTIDDAGHVIDVAFATLLWLAPLGLLLVGVDHVFDGDLLEWDE